MKMASATKRPAQAKPVPPDPAERFISKADVAMRLGKTVCTVEQRMMRGVISFIKIGKGRRATVLFKWGGTEAHLKSNFGVGFNFDQ